MICVGVPPRKELPRRTCLPAGRGPPGNSSPSTGGRPEELWAEIPAKAGTPTDYHNSESLHYLSPVWLAFKTDFFPSLSLGTPRGKRRSSASSPQRAAFPHSTSP